VYTITPEPVQAASPLQLVAVADKGSSDRCNGKDWLAIGNPSSKDVSIAGYKLSDSKGLGGVDAFTFPEGVMIPGGESVFMCQDDADSFVFGVGDDDVITLYTPASEVVDTTALGGGSGGGGQGRVWTRGADGAWGYVGNTATGALAWAAAAEFYSDNVVPEISVVVSDAKWASMTKCGKTSPTPNFFGRLDWDSTPECDYHNATCRIKYSLYNQEMPCSVRRKGSWSYRPMENKPSLKVKLANEWMGMKKFTFNNMYQDGGSLHERMAYAMYRVAGITAPRANHARVDFRKSSSQARHQMYLNLEGYNDKRYWEHRGIENHTLWEVQGPLLDSHPLSNGIYRGVGVWKGMRGLETLRCKRGCEGSPETRLKEVLSVNQPGSDSESLAKLWAKLDKDQFFRLMSVDRIISHGDGPCQKANNMWLRRSKAGKFFVLPWGLDKGFRSSSTKVAGYCSDSMLQSCLRNTGCAKDYQKVFSQTKKALGAQKTTLLSLANLAAKQTGKDVRSNIKSVITALGKYV